MESFDSHFGWLLRFSQRSKDRQTTRIHFISVGLLFAMALLSSSVVRRPMSLLFAEFGFLDPLKLSLFLIGDSVDHFHQ
jgi:hypothetical protein